MTEPLSNKSDEPRKRIVSSPPSTENTHVSNGDTSLNTMVQLYHESRTNELAAATQTSEQYRIEKFTQWCSDEGITDTTQFTGRRLYEFRVALQNDTYGDLSPYTILGVMTTVRHFIAFCERIEACEGGLSERVSMPNVDGDDQRRDSYVSAEFAQTILDHLRQFQYASRNHTIVELQWHIGSRIGGIRSLDIEDFDANDKTVRLTHRPNVDTPLKNKGQSERPVALSDTVTSIVDDYIQHHRIATEDEHGREPLFTTTHGRISRSQIRKVVSYWTQPCHYKPCPHGRSPDDCAWHTYKDTDQCPSSEPSHSIRRGRITQLKSKQLPNEVISDRVDADQQTIADHYDQRTDEQKTDLRREYLEDADVL